MLYTDNIGLKKPAYSDPADIADINENSDIIDREFGNRYLKSETYSVEQANNAIAQAIEALPNGLVYRGAVNYYKDLPTANNELGDTYSVKYQGETGTTADGNEYAWGEYDGALQWIKLGVNAYTKNEIDEQHEVIKSDILRIYQDTQGASLNSVGWYRIFEVNKLSSRRSAIINIARGYGEVAGETITLLLNLVYIDGTTKFADCNVLDKLCRVQYLDKIRVVAPTPYMTSNIAYIDLHYNTTKPNNVNAVILGINSGGKNVPNFTPINLTKINEIGEGYTAIEFDLTGGDIFDRLTALETALSQTTE